MKLDTQTYCLPAYWASYLINGDASGLEAGEEKQITSVKETQTL